LAQPQILVFGHSAEVLTGNIQTEGDVNMMIHTFEFVKLFPIKIYQNYFRIESDADRCY